MYQHSTLLEELQQFKYSIYKIYLNDLEIGKSYYRIRRGYPDWYIDTFLIEEMYQEEGYGTYLMNYICNQMWSEQHYPIRIYPVGSTEEKKLKFVSWLTKRDFVAISDTVPGRKEYSLDPY